jgi:hypothetical protein
MMTWFLRVLILGFVVAGGGFSARLLAASSGPALLQEPQLVASAPSVALSDEAMEAFLKTAKIIANRDTGVGVTNSRRATLSDGAFTHDAHIQVIDEARPVFEAGAHTELNFKDSYRYNIAAFRVARLVGLSNVPMSVERRVDGKTAAITWWVDDVKMDEKARMKEKTSGPNPERLSKQVHIMRIFDELIQNRDRNQGNILWTSDFTMWLIDHTRAFRLDAKLMKPDQLTRIDRSLLDGLRRLTKDAVATATAGLLNEGEVVQLMARRDALVRHFESRIARIGEASVLFTL